MVKGVAIILSLHHADRDDGLTYSSSMSRDHEGGEGGAKGERCVRGETKGMVQGRVSFQQKSDASFHDTISLAPLLVVVEGSHPCSVHHP